MNSVFPVIEGGALPPDARALLRPGELSGAHALPRYFYEVDSWETAKKTKLTAHFTLAELMAVDCREAPRLLREFPHYVPCTISMLARYLEEFRSRAEAPVYVAVNGGYRSPAHQFARAESPHHWASAAHIYRVGDHWLDQERTIERYARLAQAIGQEVSVKPFGHGPGETDDHLHLDLGYLLWSPAGVRPDSIAASAR